MGTDVRERMIDGAVRLLATRGLAGTSFATVLELTGSPRGSIYHHFPGGKDELVAAALDRALDSALAALDARAGESPERVAEVFLDTWRAVLTGSGYSAGCAIVAVTVDAETAFLRARCAEAFSAWRRHLAELLARGGMRGDAADACATVLLAGAEGAVVLSRAADDIRPFDDVAVALLDHVRRLPTG